MLLKWLLFCFAISFSVQAAELVNVKIQGDKQAQFAFEVKGASALPSYRVIENALELTFAGVELAPRFNGKLDIDAPHALVHRISLYSPDKKSVKAKIVINGSIEGLKQRTTISREGDEIRLAVDYPAGENATLNLLKEEQMPLSDTVKKEKAAPKSGIGMQVTIFILVLMLAIGATLFFVRFMKQKGSLKGSRKFLIEQMGYCPLGTKTGVGLVKVGSEFVLVGVTPNQVTLLSTLPKLQERYENESSFERKVFKEAVEEEFFRLRGKAGTPT